MKGGKLLIIHCMFIQFIAQAIYIYIYNIYFYSFSFVCLMKQEKIDFMLDVELSFFQVRACIYN